MELQKGISLRKNGSFKDKKLRVLVERAEGDYYVARSYRDAPEVDGEVLIPAAKNKISEGNFYIAEVYDFNEYDLFAKLIQ